MSSHVNGVGDIATTWSAGHSGQENALRIVACVNAFHNSNIKTERIGVGMVIKMLNVIDGLLDGSGNPEDAQYWETKARALLAEISDD